MISSLNQGNWTLYFGPQDPAAPASPEELPASHFTRIPARVPGNVEIDLQNAGLIDPPEVGNHVYRLRKYETCQWWYHLHFDRPDLPAGESVLLRFDGIDCIADIWLNGQVLGRTENMFVEHAFDVTAVLAQDNDLFVRIHSPILEGRKYQREHWGVRYDALGGESVHIRKAAHSYGWDILPRLVSAGIWKDVSLLTLPPTRFKSVYWVTKSVEVAQKKASLYVDWEFATDRPDIDDLVLHIRIANRDRTVLDKSFPIYSTVFRHRLNDLEDIEFWWPRGLGEANLYEATLRILDPAGHLLAEDRQPIGIRTAELCYAPADKHGYPGEFRFQVNGVPVFVKGTNWVALDALHSRDIHHIGPCVDMLVDLNCNMVRLWGGNVYEQDLFYDRCDRHGILVWQDFMMGCTTYPQDEGFRQKIAEEATKAITRI